MTAEARPDDPELALITPFLPAATRSTILALHALQAEIHHGIFSMTDESLARVKLAWWRDEIDRFMGNKARHPATQRLAQQLALNSPDADSNAIPPDHGPGEELGGEFGDLLEGVLMQLEAHLYNDDDEMLLHCWRCDAAVIVIGARLTGVTSDAALAVARHYGMARAVARLVLNFEADRRAGRCWIPETRLKALGLSPVSLLQTPPDSATRIELLTPLADLAASYFDRAEITRVSDTVQRERLRPALLMATTSMQALIRARRTDFQGPPGGRLRQLFGIWRAARREMRACRH